MKELYIQVCYFDEPELARTRLACAIAHIFNPRVHRPKICLYGDIIFFPLKVKYLFHFHAMLIIYAVGVILSVYRDSLQFSFREESSISTAFS